MSEAEGSLASSASGEGDSTSDEEIDVRKPADLTEEMLDQLFFDPRADDSDEEYMRGKGVGGTDAILSCPSCFTTVCTACQQHEVYHDQWRAVFVMNCHANRSRLVQRTRVGSKRGQGVGRTEGGSQGSKRKRRGGGGRGKVDQSARGGERGKASGQGAVGPAGASGGQREGGEESGQDLSQGAGDGPEPGELHPVVCDYCGCELGVFDADEVYHFTSVVPTY